jgi:hypothetical protein
MQLAFMYATRKLRVKIGGWNVKERLKSLLLNSVTMQHIKVTAYLSLITNAVKS